MDDEADGCEQETDDYSSRSIWNWREGESGVSRRRSAFTIMDGRCGQHHHVRSCGESPDLR